MSKLHIKNGLVFDPMNKINGEIKDILIEEGKIVEKLSNTKNVKEIDAKNKTVIPSAIDIHSHVASQQVNWVRLLGRKNKQFQEYWNNLNLQYIAQEYVKNGYTFILEANVYPSLSKQTLFNFKQIPVLDKAMLLNVSNLWQLELEFQRDMIEQASVFLSDLLDKTKGFGFKIYNPFEAENWNFQKERENLKQKGRLYNFSPVEVYEKLMKYNESLGLPHSVHAHIEGYEQKKSNENLNIILDKIKALNLTPNPSSNLQIKRSQVFHLAHASSYNPDGDNSDLIKFCNDNEAIDLDLGVVGFDPINPLITSDRGLINSINFSKNQFKLFTMGTESEGDSFSTLRTFDKKNQSHCILWANALDLALNIKNKWQIQLSFNFPNYSHVTKVSEILTWLVSKKAREEFLKSLNPDFRKNNPLSNEGKELTFNEFVIISRASPAKSLGIGSLKGNLGIGADGDLSILDLKINETNISDEYEKLKKALENIEFVIKAGNIIKKKQEIDLVQNGKIFWSSGKFEKGDKNLILNRKKEFYQKFSSMFYDAVKISIENELLREIS